jgi:hypothetical protein
MLQASDWMLRKYLLFRTGKVENEVGTIKHADDYYADGRDGNLKNRWEIIRQKSVLEP